MSKVILDIVTDSNDSHSNVTLTITSIGTQVIVSEHYLCPHLAINLDETDIPLLYIYSAEEAGFDPCQGFNYEVSIDGEKFDIPETGSEFYELYIGMTFSYTETSEIHFKTVTAKVVSIE